MYFQLEDLLKFPPPNYVNPETRGHGLTVLNSIFLALATIFVALRICSRLFVRKWFGWDDVLIILGFVGLLRTLSILHTNSCFLGSNGSVECNHLRWLCQSHVGSTSSGHTAHGGTIGTQAGILLQGALLDLWNGQFAYHEILKRN